MHNRQTNIAWALVFGLVPFCVSCTQTRDLTHRVEALEKWAAAVGPTVPVSPTQKAKERVFEEVASQMVVRQIPPPPIP